MSDVFVVAIPCYVIVLTIAQPNGDPYCISVMQGLVHPGMSIEKVLVWIRLQAKDIRRSGLSPAFERAGVQDSRPFGMMVGARRTFRLSTWLSGKACLRMSSSCLAAPERLVIVRLAFNQLWKIDPGRQDDIRRLRNGIVTFMVFVDIAEGSFVSNRFVLCK